MSTPRIEVRDYFTCERCSQIARCVELELLTGHTILCGACLRAALAALSTRHYCQQCVSPAVRMRVILMPFCARHGGEDDVPIPDPTAGLRKRVARISRRFRGRAGRWE